MIAMNDSVGEFYVSEICQLFRTNGRDLHAGRVTLCLTATCVEYLTRKLSMLQIGNSITDPPTSKDWTNLPVYLESVKSLKLIEDRNLPLRLPVSLSPFKHINTLVLKRLPVNLVIGLQRLRQQLKNLIVQRCLNDIDDALVFCGGDNANAFVWTSLVELNLSHNSIRSFGDALKYLPAVQKVDLSDNQVSTDHNGIQYVDTATFLHLGFNRLITMPAFGPRAKYNLTLLCIRNNNLDNLDGIEFLERLIELDAADNCVAEHKRINVLATLHHLTNLVLVGNPISSHSYYRKETCTCLSSLLDPKTVQLDGSFLSTSECKLLGQRSINTVTVVTPEQAMEQVFSVVIPGTGYMTPEGDVESSTPVRSPKMKRKKRKARRVNLSDSEDPLSSTGHTPSKDAPLKHYDRRKKHERMRKELQAKWLAVANFEENANKTASNIETAEEVETTQQVTLVTAGGNVVGLRMNQKENGGGGVKKETENGLHSIDHQKFDEEESFLVRLYDSDTDELSSLDRLYVCLYDRFLVERDFGSAKVIDKLDLHCLQSATVSDVQNVYHKTSFMMVLYFNYERRDRRKREYVMQNEKDTKKLMDMLLPVIKKNKTEVAVNTKMECLECHSIIDSKQVVMKESSDSDRNVTTKGFTNPFTVTSPQHLERLCPFCESSSIVEKTSLSGSMPKYNASILTDSVLARASPYAKSPILSSPVLSSSNRTPVTARKAEKEFVVQMVKSHEEKEEEEEEEEAAHKIPPTPPLLDDSSHEEHQETPPVDNIVQMDVTESTQVKTLVDSGSQEMSAPIMIPSVETSEVLHEEPVEANCDEIPEISFETTIGSLPNQSVEDHLTSFNKLTHSRSRSMDLHTKQPNRTPYSRYFSTMHPRETDETETSYTASLMEYATHKKLLKSSEASLESSLSISGAATLSDSLVPGKSYTHSSSDSRSVTPTGIPYSLDDPLYIHNSFKLYLELKVFQDDEEFKLLLRCSVVTFGQPQEFACLLLVTNEFMYICQIVAPIGSSPSKWLKFLHSHPLKKLEFVDYGIGYQSVTVEFSPPESVWYKLFPQDQQRCQDFVERLTSVVSDVQDCKFRGIKTRPQSLANLQSQVLHELSLSKEEIFGQWLCETLKQTSGLIHDQQMYHKNYPQCFSGSDLVQWLTNREEYEDNESACTLCKLLMDNSVICSVGDERRFEPNNTLYRFVTDHNKQLTLSGRVRQDHSSDKQPADVLELYLLGKWLKSGNLSQISVAVVVSSSDIFLVQESNLWPLPRYTKLPTLDNIPPQFSVLQQRKINEIHCLVLDRDQPQHVIVTFFAEDLADADVHSWLLIFETENNAKSLTKAVKVCWEAEFGIEFQIKEK